MAVFFANLMFAFVRKAPAPANQGRRFAFGYTFGADAIRRGVMTN
jgi:hypothetical protein